MGDSSHHTAQYHIIIADNLPVASKTIILIYYIKVEVKNVKQPCNRPWRPIGL
jgi:hypothetical protein